MVEFISNCWKKIEKYFSDKDEELSSAKTMFLKTKYRRAYIDDTDRKKHFLKEVLNLIKFKAIDNGEYNCTKDIPSDLIHMKDEIISDLKAKGYNVRCLGELDKNLDSTIFIYWSGIKF